MKTYNMLIIALFLSVLFPALLFSQANVAWVNYPGGVAVAADASDNVYSAYWDYSPAGDIYLTKRNADGDIQWEMSYNNTNASRHEVATWVDTDSQGNILVSGTIRSGYSNPVNANSLLMKYSPSGSLLWRVVYETDFDGSSTVKCLIDSQDNIYVLGMGTSGTGMVTKVKKFNSGGTALWSYFDSAGIGKPVNFKFTPDNAIIISAKAIYGSYMGYAKIDLGGNHLWSLAGVNSLSIGEANGDYSGNSYLVHGLYNAGISGGVIKKLSPDGSLIWEESNYNVTFFRVEVGTDNNPVVSGFPTAGTGGAAFVKYDSAGGLLWENLDADGPSYNLLSHAQMKLDADNAAYLAASLMTHMAVCKVNGDGTSAWTLTAAGGYANCMDFGTNNRVFVSSGTVARIDQETHIQVNLKVNLSGPYQNNEMTTTLNASGILPLDQPYNSLPWLYTGDESVTSFPNADIVDWVLVELRETTGDASTATPDKTIARQAGFLLKDGTVSGTDGPSNLIFNQSVSNNLYAIVWHRNHLGVMSSGPLQSIGNTYSWDYSSGVNQAFGGPNGHQQLGAGIWGMVPGDGNADRQINNADKVDVWKLQGGLSGYHAGDFNLDGQVNNQDKVDQWTPNGGRSCQVP